MPNIGPERSIVQRRKYLVLILMLVGVLIVESSARRAVLGPIVSDLFLTLIALAVFFVVFQGRRERAIAFITAVAAMVMNWSRYVTLPQQYDLGRSFAHHGLMVLFLGYAVTVILRNILTRQDVTGDEVLGAICGYLLAAGVWANAYAMTDLLLPDAFSMTPALKDVSTWQGRTGVFNYFSLVTLTTMGYGDITPARPPATTFAMLEAVFGQFYMAVVVAQLVGLRLAQALVRKNPPSN